MKVRYVKCSFFLDSMKETGWNNNRLKSCKCNKVFYALFHDGGQ